MKEIAIYTAIFSDEDKPIDFLKEIKLEYKDIANFYCFTNLNIKSDTWKIIDVEIDEDSSRRMARKYKTLPHLSMPDYEYHFWMDTSMEILISPKVIIEEYLKEHDVVAFLHPDRTCIYHEAQMCKTWNLDDPILISNQINYISSKGYPENNGLCETGVVIRKNTEQVRKFNEYWWYMVSNFSLRDQLSFNYCMWKHDIEHNVFDGLTNIAKDSPSDSVQTKLFKLYPHSK